MSCCELESEVTRQCEAVVEAVRRRHSELLSSVREQRTRKHQAFADRLADCTQTLHRTTGLLQFGIEVLKESDPAAFLQVLLILFVFLKFYYCEKQQKCQSQSQQY